MIIGLGDFKMSHSCGFRSGWIKPVPMIAVLIVVVVAAVWLWTRPASQPNVDAGRTIAETFLTQLREGEAANAWESATAEFKSAQGKEAFVRKVQPLKFLKEPLSFVSVQSVSIGNRPRTEYLFRGPSGESVRIILGNENRQWKVDHWSVT